MKNTADIVQCAKSHDDLFQYELYWKGPLSATMRTDKQTSVIKYSAWQERKELNYPLGIDKSERIFMSLKYQFQSQRKDEK